MKEIKLSQSGKKSTLKLVAVVDDLDYEWLNKYRWSVFDSNRVVYAIARINKKTVLMHRLILGLKNRKIVSDHIDGNGLNNRRNNLRKAKVYQNSANKKSATGSSSKYLGVFFKKQTGRWGAAIEKRGQRIHLGYFSKEKDAAVAYNIAAIKHHKQFARINKIF